MTQRCEQDSSKYQQRERLSLQWELVPLRDGCYGQVLVVATHLGGHFVMFYKKAVGIMVVHIVYIVEYPPKF